MIYANLKGNRITAFPGAYGAKCLGCGGDVISKCGRINAWHWAHDVADCDSWSEGETEWHLGWKSLILPQYCEVIRNRGRIIHRADIARKDGAVLELQHSPISTDEIESRESFYGNMAWLFDAKAFFKKRIFRRLHRSSIVEGLLEEQFIWLHARKSLLAVRKPMFWDIGEDELGVSIIARIKWLAPKTAKFGIAQYMTKDRFIAKYLRDVLDPRAHLDLNELEVPKLVEPRFGIVNEVESINYDLKRNQSLGALVNCSNLI